MFVDKCLKLNTLRRNQFIAGVFPNYLIEVFVVSSIVFLILISKSYGFFLEDLIPILAVFSATTNKVKNISW